MSSIEDRVELISFRICPFVMRTLITGLEKGIKFKTTYIDLKNKPKWFLEQSPTGAVPAIKVDGYFIFESAVICDLLDELTPGTLYPADPLQKYHNKSWIDFASSLLFKQFAVMTATDRSSFNTQVKEMLAKLEILEKQLQHKPYWNGKQFSIIDASYAPLLHRFCLLRDVFQRDYLSDFPRINAWADNVLSNDSVMEVCNEDYREQYLSYLKQQDSYLSGEA